MGARDEFPDIKGINEAVNSNVDSDLKIKIGDNADTHDAFISYSHADCGSIAPELQKALENIGKPWYKLKRNINVFRDETNLSASPHLWPDIEAALLHSSHLILLGSPRAKQSSWVSKELEVWVRNHYTEAEGLKNVTIVLCSGDINWDHHKNNFDLKKSTALPESFSGKFKNEPNWVDLTDYISSSSGQTYTLDNKSPGFITQVTKILGAILGKEPREIESDELKRRRYVLRFIYTISVIIIGLSIIAIWQGWQQYLAKKEAENQLAMTYWSNSQNSRDKSDLLSALHYTAAALNVSQDSILNKDMLLDIGAFVPKVYLQHILSHNAAVKGAVFSPDQQKLLTWSDNYSICIWNTKTGRLLKVFKHDDVINTASFNSEGNLVISSSNDKTCRIWNVQTGKLLNKFSFKSPVSKAIFSGNGHRFLIVTWDNTVTLGETTSRKITYSINTSSKKPIEDVVYSSDGKLILSGSQDSTARLWNASTGKQMFCLKHHGMVLSSKFSPNQKFILTASADSLVRVWNMSNGRLLFPPIKHLSCLRGAKFISDGKKFITYSDNGDIRIFWSATGEEVPLQISQHTIVDGVELSEDQQKILSWGRDGSICVWDASTGSKIGATIQHTETATATFSPNQKLILSSGLDGVACLWKVRDTKQFSPALKHDGLVYGAIFSKNQKNIVTWSSDGTAKIWGMLSSTDSTGTEVKRGPQVVIFSSDHRFSLWIKTGLSATVIEVATERQVGQEIPFKGKIVGAVLSFDNKYLMIWDAKNSISIYNIIKGQQEKSFPFTGVIQNAVFSPNGQELLISFRDGTLQLKAIWQGSEIVHSAYFKGGIKNAAFSSDMKYVLLIESDSTCRLLNASSLKLLGKPMKHRASIYGAAFSPNQKQVISWGQDSTLKIWSVPECNNLITPIKHKSAVNEAIYSLNQRFILTRDNYGAYLWDPLTGKQIGETLLASRALLGATISTDQKQILTWGTDNTIRRWSLTGQQLGTPMFHADIREAIFSKDPQKIISWGFDSTVRLWNVKKAKQIGASIKAFAVPMWAQFQPNLNEISIISEKQELASNYLEECSIQSDLDIPHDLFQLQAQALTGIEFDNQSLELKCIPRDRWEKMCRQYKKEAMNHYLKCKYKRYNLGGKIYNTK